ncbi:hypothetical protein [Halovenus halobia]|uniref:hypothetical protein n=1 Tax=Halovenus halobia TaxID=3396622 RepID=UPI003F5602AC
MPSARATLLADHQQTIEAVVDAARAIANAHGPFTEPHFLRRVVTEQLQSHELLEPLLAMLTTAAEAVGETVQGAPLPAPPYLSVTSRGPVCRGTLSDGRRVVIELVTFAVERQPRRYVFCDPDPVTCLSVEFR